SDASAPISIGTRRDTPHGKPALPECQLIEATGDSRARVYPQCFGRGASARAGHSAPGRLVLYRSPRRPAAAARIAGQFGPRSERRTRMVLDAAERAADLRRLPYRAGACA